MHVRILILHDPYKPIENGSIGGEDNLAQLEIDQLALLGHEVVDGRFFDLGTSRKFNQVRAQTYGSNPEVLSLIQKFRPNVIHTHNLSQRSGYRWMVHTRVPIVSSIHNYRLFCASSIAWRNGKTCFECRDNSPLSAITHGCDGLRGSLNASRQLVLQPSQPQINRPTLFLTGSEMMNQALAPLIPSKKLRILRNPGLAKTNVSKKVGPRIGWLFAGRFVEEKGIIELIKAWPEGETLDIAGSGPLKTEIESMILNRPHIKMIGTFPPGTADIYYQYEGLIFPSTWLEGSPLVIADALSTGTPVIAMGSSASKEQVEISKAGVVITEELATSNLAAALIDIRSNFERYSQNAKNASGAEFSIKRWSRNLSDFLSEAVQLG
jgi:glycosyltransferase involved in cell wall biosynthesis